LFELAGTGGAVRLLEDAKQFVAWRALDVLREILLVYRDDAIVLHAKLEQSLRERP